MLNLFEMLPYEGLKTAPVLKGEGMEIRLISLEQEALLPEHSSKTDASILVLEGSMEFEIGGQTRQLNKGDFFNFSAGELHQARGITNCRFILIR